MDTAEWGIAGLGSVTMGLGLTLLLATSRELWRGVSWFLMVGGLLAMVLAFVAAPALRKLTAVVIHNAEQSGRLAPAVPKPKGKVALLLLATELQTIRASVNRLLSEGKFPRGVTLLPTQRWRECQELVAEKDRRLYGVLADAYSRADEFNRMTVDRANLYVGRWLDFHPDDDLEGFVASLDAAIAALHDEGAD